MPRPRRQGEIALETWETLYKEKDDSPTVLVQKIIDHHEQIAKEKIASLQTELNDALALVEQQSTKIKAMAKAAKLLVAGPPKVTGGKTSKSDSPQDSSRETWEGTINDIGAILHLLQAEKLYQEGDMKGLTTVAENAVTCAGKQLDKKLLAEAWTWLGTAYSNRGNLKSGVEAFKRAQEVIKTLNQKDKDVASMKVLVDKWQGDLKEPEAKFSAMLAKMQKR
ncbi:hypothetical protein V496_00025 [Pseudogymnoascus sp. VKM F-4515 (FW-2607)]|nr:hypothetical protein V496_00025 [Pseudogymnoascus sp. VKM F-4515 (FW-2607)]KFY83445.1 hypothetical protein V498_08074 [Pseudogymnoascus sp. VKM F-4517 (FW-2822)]